MNRTSILVIGCAAVWLTISAALAIEPGQHRVETIHTTRRSSDHLFLPRRDHTSPSDELQYRNSGSVVSPPQRRSTWLLADQERRLRPWSPLTVLRVKFGRPSG